MQDRNVINPIIVAIDGGSGAGKSTTARALAKKLDFLYVDTGAHYRTVTYFLQLAKIPYTDPGKIEHELAHWSIDEIIEDGAAHIRLNHKKLDESQLRSAMVNTEVSYYAVVPIVRKYLLHFQQSQAQVAALNEYNGLVMEGRDIGINIFPKTPFKYFFVADSKVKMERRAKEGELDITDTRDQIDITRGQLRKAFDAVKVDTSKSSFEEVVDWVYKDIQSKLPSKKVQ